MHPLDKIDNTKYGSLDFDYTGATLRRDKYPSDARIRAGVEANPTKPERLKIEPTLDNADLVRHYNPWVQWNPEPQKEEPKHPDHTHHALDKVDNTKYGSLPFEYTGAVLRRDSYPDLDHLEHTADDDHSHDRTIHPITFKADEFAPLGRYFQAGNTDLDKFYDTEIHHTYLPRRPVKRDPLPEVLEYADWARSVR